MHPTGHQIKLCLLEARTPSRLYDVSAVPPPKNKVGGEPDLVIQKFEGQCERRARAAFAKRGLLSSCLLPRRVRAEFRNRGFHPRFSQEIKVPIYRRERKP